MIETATITGGVPFTATSDQEIEQELARELNEIARLVRERAGHLIQALVLAGGFGRGEGGAMKTGAGIRVINDYDLIAIVKQRDVAEMRRLVHGLSEELEARTTAKQVDLAVVAAWKLLIPSPSVARYEIRQGHRALWGAIPFPIAALPARFLPLEEGTKYLRNRGSGLLIARLLLDGCGTFSPDQRADYALIEIDKALIAIGDAALIAAGRYHYLYEERRRRVAAGEGMQLTNEDVAAYAEAVERKVRPGRFEQPSMAELATRWEKVRTRFLAYALDFEEHRLESSFSDMTDYLAYCSEKPSIASRLFWTRGWSIEDKAPTKQIRLKTFDLLQRYAGIEKRPQCFELWKDEVVEMLRQWHPGGIVSRIIN